MKSYAIVMALAVLAIALAGCSPESSDVEPTVEGDGIVQQDAAAAEAIDGSIVAEDDSVELGELV